MSASADSEDEESSRREPAELNKLLHSFNLYGWRPDTKRSVDENYMELVLLVTRNSICLQGYMACVLVDPSVSQSSAASTVEELERSLYGGIIGIATNKPLYSELDSDVHAEIGALGLACRIGNSTEGCTAYITMPPCKRCFAAMLVSGVKRIVSRRPAVATILPVAREHGIDIVELVETTDQLARIQSLTVGGNQAGARTVEQQVEIREQRKRRKKAMRQKKSAKKRRQEEAET
jgi:deoxycytidylate deaminase